MTNIINLYPTLLSKVYVFFRQLILTLDDIKKYLHPNSQVLDVGCGYGVSTILLAKEFNQIFFTGIELDKNRINLAKIAGAKIPNLKFVAKNLANSEPDSSYDTVLLIDLLHHLTKSQRQTLFSQIYAILKPSGQLIIKDINPTPRIKYFWNYLHDFLATGFKKSHYFSSSQLQQEIFPHQFKFLKQQSIYSRLYPHQLYVFQK